MLRRMLCCLCAGLMLAGLGGCAKAPKAVKIGASFGVGSAARWPIEKAHMEERAKELGVEIDARINPAGGPKTQDEDCRELIDSGIDVLILMPRNAGDVGEILAYARGRKVKVICYARVVLEETADLFVGYDSHRMGQSMGLFLSELVYEGDYILLRGDEGDNNAKLLYEGAMRYIDPIRGDINILLDAAVPGWSEVEATRMVKEAVAANGNHVDAILAPNDTIAGGCLQALEELGVTAPVVITGMDAELDAVRRIVAGTQSMTIYLDLKELAYTAVDQACHIARGEEVEVNADFDNGSGSLIPSNLIVGQTVTKQNVDKVLIESGYFTREEVYGGN